MIARRGFVGFASFVLAGIAVACAAPRPPEPRSSRVDAGPLTPASDLDASAAADPSNRAAGATSDADANQDAPHDPTRADANGRRADATTDANGRRADANGGRRADANGASRAGARGAGANDADAVARAAREAECRKSGGHLEIVGGLAAAEECVIPLRDTGHVCHDASQCRGECVLTAAVPLPNGKVRLDGKCSRLETVFGCVKRIGSTPGGAGVVDPSDVPHTLCVD